VTQLDKLFRKARREKVLDDIIILFQLLVALPIILLSMFILPVSVLIFIVISILNQFI
jgi:hypothetical protein